MADDLIAGSAGQAGSSNGSNQSDPAQSSGAGQSAAKTEDYKALYEELQGKLGEQGNELGEYRTFFKNVSPLLDKLDSQPELVQAILAGKVDAKLATAVAEGKVTIGEAAAVTQAHAQVKKELGKEYKNTPEEDIEKLISDKLTTFEQKITQSISEKDDLKEFEAKSAEFIASKADFSKYADDVTKWLENHPTIDDIEVAYSSVKGIALEKALSEGNEKKLIELAKEMAANASGGSSMGGTMTANKNILDELIAPRHNVNLL